MHQAGCLSAAAGQLLPCRPSKNSRPLAGPFAAGQQDLQPQSTQSVALQPLCSASMHSAAARPAGQQPSGRQPLQVSRLLQVSNFFSPARSEQEEAGRNKYLTEQNAQRLADALCRMRGAALKLGQMLSIQDEGMIPPQVTGCRERPNTRSGCRKGYLRCCPLSCGCHATACSLLLKGHAAQAPMHAVWLNAILSGSGSLQLVGKCCPSRTSACCHGMASRCVQHL